MANALLLLSMLLFMFFFFFSLFHGVQSLTLPTDVAALEAFKAAISPATISSFSCLGSWNFNSDPCRPAINSDHFVCGISCSVDSTRIAAITLDSAGYSGKLSPAISGLTALTHLDLSNNNFYGTIPGSLSALSSLQTLVLASNSFSGSIPSELSRLASLQTVDISRNSLTGSLPASFSSLKNLRVLDMSYNKITGELPSSLPSNLIQLALKRNSLSGHLHRQTFAPLQNLEVVELAGNKIQGALEGWFLLLPSLQQLDLANNSLTKLEVWKANNAGENLVAVDIGFNRVGGRLPAELAGYPSLVSLSIRYNRLVGAIPREFYGAKVGVPFKRLFLDGNFLNGSPPEKLLGGDVAGSFGDNCLEKCPASVSLCSPVQKPYWVCKQAYGTSAAGRPRPRTE